MVTSWEPGQPAWFELVRNTIDALPTTEEPVQDTPDPTRRLGERIGAWIVLLLIATPALGLTAGGSWRLFRWAAGL